MSRGPYLTAPNTGVNFTGEMTCSLWAFAKSLNSGYYFARSRQSPQRFRFGMYLTNTPSFGAFLGDGGFGASHITGGAPRIRVWHHFVFTVTGGTAAKLYADGKIVASSTLGNALGASVDPVSFGAWSDGFNACDGLVQDVAVWNYCLDYEAIGELYGGRDPRTLLPGNLRGFWRLRGKNLEPDESAFASYATASSSGVENSVILPYDSPPRVFLSQLNTPAFLAGALRLPGIVSA